MSDLISREALLEEINENQWGWFSREMLLSMLENQPSVTCTNSDKWIPCSERLPDDFMSFEYLTIRKGQTLATITYYCVVNHKWYSNRKSTKEIDVIAWMPLPPAYKGE